MSDYALSGAEAGGSAGGSSAAAPSGHNADYGRSSVLTIRGDALHLPLREYSVDAVMCDPPYGLEFMGKDWDTFGDHRQPGDANFTAGTGPYGRAKVRHGMAPSYRSKATAGMAPTGSIVGGDGVLPSYLGGLNPKCRRCDCWQRGSNPCRCERPDFPNERGERMHVFQDWTLQWATEALRVAKPGAWLVAFGGTRTHHRLMAGIEDAGWEIRDMGVWLYRNGFPKSRNIGDGRGTALKPSIECWVLARAPLSERNVTLNVGRWGTGALNIDAARHPFASSADKTEASEKSRHADFGTAPGGNEVYGDWSMVERTNYDADGRWPANAVTLEDDEVLRHFRIADFPKASSDEKPWDATAKRGPRQTDTGSPVEPGEFGGNPEAIHPTVKPVDLMRHLIRLTVPPGGLVLDQFAGTGTTLQAALMEGRSAIGVERDPAYLPLITRRLSRPLAVSMFGGAA